MATPVPVGFTLRRNDTLVTSVPSTPRGSPYARNAQAQAVSARPAQVSAQRVEEDMKPKGQHGRSYNLEQALGWTTLEYGRVRKRMEEICLTHCLPRKTWRDQPQETREQVFTEIHADFPALLLFPGHWATIDLMKVILYKLNNRAKRATNRT